MESNPQYSQHLQKLMDKVNISNLQELSNLSGISERQLFRLEEGLLPTMEVRALLKLCQVLQVSIIEMLENFCSEDLLQKDILTGNINQQEYINYKKELEQQKDILENQFQKQTLQILESYLIQLPTVLMAIEQNPQLPAQRLIPIIKPIENLLEKWEIKPLEKVGDQVNYNPQLHQLMEGIAQKGDRVKVRYVGYTQRDKLLYRAKVSPIN
jgi:DNA-binding Xre family transcriptional regulator